MHLESRGSVPRIAASAALITLALMPNKDLLIQHSKHERRAQQLALTKPIGHVLLASIYSFSYFEPLPIGSQPPTAAYQDKVPTSAVSEVTAQLSPHSRVLLRRIAGCESAGSPNAPINYVAQNPSSSASGGYQILDTTWAGYGGYRHAKDAPPVVQTEKAVELYKKDQTQPWVYSESCWS